MPPSPSHVALRSLFLAVLAGPASGCDRGVLRVDDEDGPGDEPAQPTDDSEAPDETEAPPDTDSSSDDSEPGVGDSEPPADDSDSPPPLDCRHRVEVFTGSSPEDIGFRIERVPRKSPQPLIWLAGQLSSTPNTVVTAEVQLPPDAYDAYPYDKEYDGWDGATYAIYHVVSGTLVASGTLGPDRREEAQRFRTTCTAP